MTYEITSFIDIGSDLAQCSVFNKATPHIQLREQYAVHADMLLDTANLCIRNTRQAELPKS